MMARLLLAAAVILPTAGCMSDRTVELLRRQIRLIVEGPRVDEGPIHEEECPPPSPPVFAAPLKVPVTVANVRKDEATLFTVAAGKLTFLARVPAGEAVDVAVPGGTNLAATFASAPYCANYHFKNTPGEVWLLRPAPAAAVGPACRQ